MASEAEQRGFSRVGLAGRISVELPDGTLLAGTVADLSLSGARVATAAPVQVGTAGPFVLLFGEGEGALRIRGRARVSRAFEGGVAVAFEELEHDGYLHLRELVRHNADDVDRVEDEFAAHRGLKPR